jgi:hypothetical protein
MVIHDWEVQAAYFKWKRLYGTQALDRLRQKYEQELPLQNLHCVMGTMHGHRRTFIIIGLIRSTVDPADVMRQPGLI